MLFLRGFVYLLLVSVVAQLISLEGYEMLSAAEYSEHSVTEHLQDIMSFLSCMLFLYVARHSESMKIAATLLAALMGMMFVRESDSLLDQYVFDGAWQSVVLVIIACVLVFLCGQFKAIYPSIKVYADQACFGTFLAGFVTILGFSRLMGRGSFWEAVMGDAYMRVVKNIVEEGIETLGYTLILISAVELMLACRRQKRKVKAH
ncbi:hypothetical protein [Marinomonas posidonica]|uniref:Uncharacterized protein n=1 Tax=Marinomonas posidonica (strain CECT 7376 / NCIMB 14433 / IVIA-Po-181) TaxID=491952 RepID=F6CWB2_MARPP|nr:hypothetical protein [Marinomonas posidonica]AEF55473.1 hypothetical protein Mar181_2440 [Marinomonas posidonica IVIA-Po-181]